jgi:myo-inositol 2-dehydrogenase/D-chiro-inositol 1-dehydrogenase
MTSPQHNRREFLKAGAAVATAGVLAGGVYAAGSDEIKVGLIGCGGRGTQACENVLQAAKGVKVVALADAFEDRAKNCSKHLQSWIKEDKEAKAHGNSVEVEGRVFTGLDAYKKVIDSPEVNYVILATPPGFRPEHIVAAVNAKKHIFTEKPVGVDAPGIAKVLEAYVEADTAKLGIAAGTQRRHQTGYLETMKRIHDGEIGEVVGGRCAWNQGILWHVPRKKEWTDLQYQMRNWYNFTWICGDHIVEQHVHNIDVINWAIKGHPVKAIGMGYRTRTDPKYGHIFDFFSVDFEYPGGVHVHSQCRQISGCDNDISEFVKGTKGTSQINAYQINGKPVFNRKKDNRPYVAEHTNLIKSIRDGKPINELKNVAESTLTAIMGRMSAYTGKTVTWEMAKKSKQVLMPENLAFDMKLLEPPVAKPGRTKFV